MNKVYFKPNDRNFMNISKGISVLQPKHFKVLFPGQIELPDHYYHKDRNGDAPDLNQEQRSVVNRILRRSSPHPFILFGPPGTGKTTTICTSIKLLYETQLPFKKLIIVAAPR